MKTTLLSLISLLVIVLTSCSNGSGSLWTDQDIENARKNCMFGKDPSFTDEEQKRFCDCWLEKVKTESPDPKKQSAIPMDKVNQITIDCRKAIGK